MTGPVGGRLDGRSAARLLLAAAIVDLVLVAFLARLLLPVLPISARGNEVILAFLGVFIALLALYWVLSELVLGGRSFGRSILQLDMRTNDGGNLPATRKAARFVGKLTFLGLTGLNPNGAARYDRKTGASWFSPMAPKPIKPFKDWALQVRSGNHAGKPPVRLEQIPGFRKTGNIKIGRDPAWADLPLVGDGDVSGQHCVLMLRDGSLYIMDYGGAGKPGARNGTFLDNRRLKPGKAEKVGLAQSFRLGNVVIRIDR
ncbi:FHA domain-containing protein [Litoreibacter roseus]|uniref:FHA domain-containing protein n=1 Tax=Litoreibacter roseus TaxID=2601869 RepID=A0A6N6JCL8_9RHOB|nr:FHA domain-containing protein [Litoreibacter roseus]GFE64081.1 hypothetical protein KIN_11550 [Litoreibacter roseus]